MRFLLQGGGEPGWLVKCGSHGKEQGIPPRFGFATIPIVFGCVKKPIKQ
jgi:hypothetical protein